MGVVKLDYSTVRTVPTAGVVETIFDHPHAKLSSQASRPDTPENRAQAVEQGYADNTIGLWDSLRDHELLHNLVGAWVWDAPSPTLLHEAGGPLCPYGVRLYEEGIVLAMQRFLQTGDLWKALSGFDLVSWYQHYKRASRVLRKE